jgi:hypothetical protein
MGLPLLFNEYVEAAKLVHQRANSEKNLYARHILQDIEHSYYLLVEFERHQQRYNRPFAHFGLFDGR